MATQGDLSLTLALILNPAESAGDHRLALHLAPPQKCGAV